MSEYGERAHVGLSKYKNICQTKGSLPIEFRPYENMENVPNVQGIFAERLEFRSAIRHISRVGPSSRNSMSGARGI